MKLPTNLLNGVRELVNSDRYSIRIKEFKGLLSPFVYCITSSERCYVYWMKEYGDAKSWTKQFTVVPQGKVERPLGFTKSGKIILEMNGEKLVLYDPERKQFQDLGFVGLYGAQATFTENLALLEREKGPLFF